MKKVFFISLIALILVCAVACSSSPKMQGIAVVNDPRLRTLVNSGEYTAKLEYVSADYDNDETMEVPIEKLSKGSFYIDLEPGKYKKATIMLYNNEGRVTYSEFDIFDSYLSFAEDEEKYAFNVVECAYTHCVCEPQQKD